MAFITLDDWKEQLGIPASNTKLDQKLGAIVSGVNAEILACLGIDQCEPADYALSADLDCDLRHDTLWIAIAPVISVSDVYNGTTLQDATAYRCRDRRLRLLCGDWCCGVCCDGTPSVRATVRAGFDLTVPRLAAAFYAIQSGAYDYATMRKGGAGAGVKSETIGRYSVTYADGADSAGSLNGNGPAHWPASLAAAMAPFQSLETGELLSREC